jgi:hypothetical protein
MKQSTNGHSNIGDDIIEAAQPDFNPLRPFRGWPVDGNMFRDVPILGFYAGIWNGYLNAVMEVQQYVMRANQSVLQTMGIPTTEEVARLNRQLFETQVRLDTLEARLDEIETKK